MSESKDIDAALEAIAFGVYDSGVLNDRNRWWPRSYLPYSPLFAESLHADWLRQWRLIDRTSKPYARGTAIWVLLAMASRTLKVMFEASERVAIFDALLNDIEQTSSGDIFCRDGRHLVLHPDQAQAIAGGAALVPATDRTSSRAFSVLNAMLLAHSEAVFFSANCTARDVHGPYPVRHEDRDRFLVVRDYYTLRNLDLEPLTGAHEYDSVSTFSIYDQDPGFHFSVLNDYTTDVPLHESVVANGARYSTDTLAERDADADVVSAITSALSKVIQGVGERVQHLTNEDEAIEVIRRTFYRRQPVACAVGESWEMPDTLMSNLRDQLPKFDPRMPPVSTRPEFLVAIDPRI